MPKKKRDEYLEEVTRLADMVDVAHSTLSIPELEELLREAGVDPAELEGCLHTTAKDIESRIWATGKQKPPAYLARIIEQTALPEALPSDTASAIAKARAWVSQFTSGLIPNFTPTELAVVRAYRKDGELSAQDSALLDQLEAELKEKVRRSDDK